jgi:tetratricopeptide (TPR) repeat protein
LSFLRDCRDVQRRPPGLPPLLARRRPWSTKEWAERVEAFWSTADDTDPERMLSRMRALVDERPANDARARYEWASVQDLLGMEAAAIEDYRAALDAGLDEEHEAQAVVQLASSLRNVGDPGAAIELLQSAGESPTTGAATRAFLALALHDAGQTAQALQVALLALAPTLPLYGRAVSRYATALVDRGDAPPSPSDQH